MQITIRCAILLVVTARNKHCLSAESCVFVPKQPTPRKGTETCRCSSGRQPEPETTHTPQGDGNTSMFDGFSRSLETTHTPQGDGNIAVCNAMLEDSGNNPHPARGRKLISFVKSVSQFQKQPTPRKGAETKPHPVQIRRSYGNNLHPARGRKRHQRTHGPPGKLKQPTPHKGTETPASAQTREST